MLCPVCGCAVSYSGVGRPSKFCPDHRRKYSRPGAKPTEARREPITLRPVTEGERGQEDWRYRAACAGEDLDMFFPEGSPREVQRQVEEAKAVCDTCPVLHTCREWAMSHGRGIEFGVFGGLTPHERRKIITPVSARDRRRAIYRGEDPRT